MTLGNITQEAAVASRTMDIETRDGVCDTYVSHPGWGGPFPAVILFMDGFGIRPALRQMADRIAAEGYYVLLPNMFYRHGRASAVDMARISEPDIRRGIVERAMSLTSDLVVRDAGVFLDALARQKEVLSGSKTGLTGYCMGGGMVVRTAAHYPDRVAAGASFHGGMLATEDLGSPHLLISKIQCRLYFGYADQDPFMTPEQIERLDRALKPAGAAFKTELYVGALHGFTMSDLPAFNQKACDRHWDRLLDLFEETLQAPRTVNASGK
jgi:carboxymethylenebutenolidase